MIQASAGHFWHDYNGTIVAGIVGAITIGAAILIFLRQRLKTVLEWTARRLRIQLSPAAAGKLKVLFNDIELKQPTIVTIRVANVGRTAIAETDFREPLIMYVDGATVLSAEHLPDRDGVTRSLDLASQLSDPKFVIFRQYPYLNTKSWLEVQLVVDGSIDKVSLKCVVLGQTKPIRPHKGPETMACCPGSRSVVRRNPYRGLNRHNRQLRARHSCQRKRPRSHRPTHCRYIGLLPQL
jgi:hypothetical protein